MDVPSQRARPAQPCAARYDDRVQRAGVRERGVRAEFFVHVDEAREVQPDPEGWLRSQAEAWRARYWPFGDPAPTLYVDPRAAVAKLREYLLPDPALYAVELVRSVTDDVARRRSTRRWRR